jgi:hypothetical protein
MRVGRIAFAFGLLHGFGFASVQADMGLPSGARHQFLHGNMSRRAV